MIQGQIFTGAMMDIIKVMAGTINIEHLSDNNRVDANEIIQVAIRVIRNEITEVAANAQGIHTKIEL